MRVSRYEKGSVDLNGDVFRCRRVNSRPFYADQIVHETDHFYFVNPIRTNKVDISAPRLVERSWNLVDEIAIGRTGKADIAGLNRGVSELPPLTIVELDRALNMAQDMGRWDMAFRMILDLYAVEELDKASVVWERFPHRSAMAVIVGDRMIAPGGAAKDVIEKWWAYNGGYHGPSRVYLPADSEYKQFMTGVRNPFTLCGVDRAIHRERIARALLPVAHLPGELTAERLAGREWWSHDRVAYLADVDGVVLPYWYVNENNGREPNRVAWDEQFRKRLASHMLLPLLVQRRVERFYAEHPGR